MQETTNLAARLKEQMRRENAIIQNLTRKQLNDMRSALTGILQQELSTIKSDIQRQSRGIGWSMLRSRVLWPMLVGLSLCLGIFGGSWAMMRYSANQIMELQRNIQELQRNIQILERDGGKIRLSRCGPQKRLCAQIDETAPAYEGGYRILKGY
jgi:hypothetical protein